MKTYVVPHDKYKTDIIFRKEKSGDFKGEISAMFPHEVCEHSGNVTCYVHIGQHCSANYNHCIQKTVPAIKSEYMDLYRELSDIGYNINIVKRQNYDKYLKSYKTINH